MASLFAPSDVKPNQPLTPPEEARSATPVTALDVIASPSDMELVGRIRTLFQRARAERKPIVQQWVRNYRVMRNRTWRAGRLDWMPQPEVPEVRSTIGALVAWLTDQRPEFDLDAVAQPYGPYSGMFQSLATDMKTAMDASWQTYLYEREVETMVWDSYQYGVGVLKTVWDPKLADGMGDVSTRRIDPFTFYPDPAGTDDESCNYFFEVRTISLQELDRRFPGAADKFSLQGFTENVDEAPRLRLGTGMIPRANPGAISPATSASYGLPGQGRVQAATNDTGVTLIEAWLREHVPSKDGKRVYDSWRCICIAGPHVLMNKRADEILPFKKHPYDVYRPESTGEYFPQSMVELLTPSQLSINHALASIEQNIDLAANPPFKESTRSGLQRTKINPSQPGVRVTVAAGDTESGWMTPPSLPLAGLELVKFHIQEMERTSGLYAISSQMGNSRISADVYDSAQEAGFVRIRLAQRNLEFVLRSVGQKYAAIVAEFYTEPRFLALVGPDGMRSIAMLRGRHFYVPSPGADPADPQVPLRFEVAVRAGSMLPTSRNARIGEIDTLYAMGAVDRPVVLEAHKIPNRQAILERIAEMEAKGTFAPPGARQRSGR